MLRVLILLCLIALPARAERVLVIGDSVAAWNGHGVGDAIASALDAEVTSNARSGASISPEGLLGRLLGPIPKQLRGGPWDWVVMVGGANDIRFECDCGQCLSTIEELISDDGARGEIPALVSSATAAGARVIWADYYTSRRGAAQSSAACLADWARLEARTQTMGQTLSGVMWVDMSEVMDPQNPDDFARDNLHPSEAGSVKIGELIAEAIAGAE